MFREFTKSIILNRLPKSLFGITHVSTAAREILFK
jgi:hypothetical protein